MDTYEILKEYKEITSAKNNFIRYYKINRYIIIGIVLTIIVIVLNFVGGLEGYRRIINTIGIYLVLFCIPLYLFRASNKVLEKEYNGISQQEFSKRLRERFYLKLETRGVDFENKEQIEQLIEIIEEDMETLKPKSLVKWGIVTAIMLPI